MNAEHEARLADIRSGPWREQSRLARERVATLSPAEAQHYFRSHYDDPNGITDREEIDFRESFDQALDELELLELAVASGYLPLDAVRSAAVDEFHTLLTPNVSARAYVQTYDFVPVRYLAARLGIDLRLGPVVPPPINPRAAVRYASFLASHIDFTTSVPVTRFTMLLDDYRLAGIITAPFLKDQLSGAHALLDESQEEQFHEVSQGFVQFVQILGDLFAQLDPAEQPVFGCTYAYWLGHFFGVRRVNAGYEPRGVSFEDASPSPALFPHGLDSQGLLSEQKRLRDGIGILRTAWDRTRALIESIE